MEILQKSKLGEYEFQNNSFYATAPSPKKSHVLHHSKRTLNFFRAIENTWLKRCRRFSENL